MVSEIKHLNSRTESYDFPIMRYFARNENKPQQNMRIPATSKGKLLRNTLLCGIITLRYCDLFYVHEVQQVKAHKYK
jgi:hypothetical protein